MNTMVSRDRPMPDNYPACLPAFTSVILRMLLLRQGGECCVGLIRKTLRCFTQYQPTED